MRVEPEAFSSVVGALPIPELLGYISNMEYLINVKIENMLHGLGGKFFTLGFIEFLSKLHGLWHKS